MPNQSSLIDLLRRGGNEALGHLDATGQLLKGVALQPVSGLAGASQGVADLLRGKGWDQSMANAAKRVEDVQGWGGGPATERGGELLQTMGKTLEPVVEKLHAPADWIGERSPLAGAAAMGFTEMADPTKLLSKVKTAGRAAKAAINTAKATPGPGSLRADIEAALPPKGTVTPKVEPITFDITTPEGAAAFEAREGRKPVHLMSEAERVKHFGPAMAETPTTKLSDIRSRRELEIPGGLEAGAPPMTLADQAKISAQGIDYNTLHPELAKDIHKRLVQSVDPGANPSKLELMNRLGFGITSGNAPITKNLIEWAQMRPRSQAELGEWANYSPVGIGEQVPGGATDLNRQINQAYGVQAQGAGGTGVANTANRQYVSDLASMLRSNEGYFRKNPGEIDREYVERLMNQVRGLGPKTGSLGFAMIEPQTTNISAIDRHIADLTREQVSQNPATKGLYEQQMLNAYNLAQPKGSPKFPGYTEARAAAGAEAPAIEGEQFRNVVSSPQTRVYIDAKTGQSRADMPSHLRNLPFYQPKESAQIGPLYDAALQQIEAGGKKRGIGGFSNQWFDWDYQRSRAEPHAGMNPMATEMPRMTPEEYKQVRDTFSQAGAMRTTKEPETGRLRGLSPTADWRRLIYGHGTPAALAATGAGAAGTAALIKALREKPKEQEDAFENP